MSSRTYRNITQLGIAGENEQGKALDHVLAVAKSKQFAGKLTNIDEWLKIERKTSEIK